MNESGVLTEGRLVWYPSALFRLIRDVMSPRYFSVTEQRLQRKRVRALSMIKAHLNDNKLMKIDDFVIVPETEAFII